MQAQGYIQSVGYDVDAFWEESSGLAHDNDMDRNLAYMFKMVEESQGHFVLNKEKLPCIKHESFFVVFMIYSF